MALSFDPSASLDTDGECAYRVDALGQLIETVAFALGVRSQV